MPDPNNQLVTCSTCRHFTKPTCPTPHAVWTKECPACKSYEANVDWIKKFCN